MEVMCGSAAGSVGVVGEIAASVDEFLAGLRERVGDVLGGGSDRELAAALQQAERLQRGVEALAVEVVGDVDRRGLFAADGHRSTRAWVKASVRVPDSDVSRRVRTCRLFRVVPEVAELMAAGRLGAAQARVLAAVLHNPRIADDEFVAAAGGLIESALNDDFEEFAVHVREWERLTDADGAHRDSAAAHEGRDARLAGVGDTVYLDGRFGVMQGATMQEILDAFAQAEFQADWDEARRLYGDAACARLLARTVQQRRADALYAIFLAAAIAPLAGKDVTPTVNIVVDQQTFEDQLADLLDPFHLYRNDTSPAGHPPAHPPADPCGDHTDIDADDVTARFCRTASGLPVDPAHAVVAAMLGQVRRVVVGSDGVVIDLGRRSRLFTGSAREAAILQAALDRMGRCLWPGCRLGHCQIDHSTEWADLGETRPDNSGPACRHHNVIKTRGYTTRRDDHGRWHTYRPDGTEITPV